MKRPCECGCPFEKHEIYGTVSMYCKECPIKSFGSLWCYNYRPIKNLEYLEWLSR
jgi:hypothetical protein